MNINIAEIIAKKRDNEELTASEIKEFIDEYTAGNIPDYQASALLMAIFLNGMSEAETFALTDAMRYSGDNIDLSAIEGIKVDKHSTGGVGDKVTLIVAPTVAACGVPIAKMSGRGLGFTGGTIDKLESIEGFQTTLSPEDFFEQVNDIGIAIIGQSGDIAPADKKLYALRDVTATVGNFSLISSSIMSKKLASGSDAIILDVKCGSGAFMENEDDAKHLAKLMCAIGKSAGKNTVAVVTDMSQPLGKAVGNSLEVIEAIETLKGKGPKDITELSMHLSGIMIYLGGKAKTISEGRLLAENAIKNGSALIKFRHLIEKQGGNGNVVDDYSLFKSAKLEQNIYAKSSGHVHSIEASMIGEASQRTGAGRAVKDDEIDHTAGIIVNVKVGDCVKKGDVIATVYSNDEDKLNNAVKMTDESFMISNDVCEAHALIKETIGI